jgi:hypothetical protein
MINWEEFGRLQLARTVLNLSQLGRREASDLAFHRKAVARKMTGPHSHRGGHWFDPSIAHQVNPMPTPVEIGAGAMCRRSAGIVEPVDHQEIDPSVAPICRRRERAPGAGGWRPGSLDGCEDAWIFQ